MENTETNLVRIVVLAELSDGTIRQVACSPDELTCVTGVLESLHGGTIQMCIKVLDGLSLIPTKTTQ